MELVHLLFDVIPTIIASLRGSRAKVSDHNPSMSAIESRSGLSNCYFKSEICDPAWSGDYDHVIIRYCALFSLHLQRLQHI